MCSPGRKAWRRGHSSFRSLPCSSSKRTCCSWSAASRLRAQCCGPGSTFTVLTAFEGRVLPLDARITVRGAALHVPYPRADRCHRARARVVVTHNVVGFAATGVESLKPFRPSGRPASVRKPDFWPGGAQYRRSWIGCERRSRPQLISSNTVSSTGPSVVRSTCSGVDGKRNQLAPRTCAPVPFQGNGFAVSDQASGVCCH